MILDHLKEFQHNLSGNIKSGLLVSLIAFPLSLAIANGSGVPPLSALIAAMMGGVILSFLTTAPIVIAGPAAGLIPVVLSARQELGELNLLFQAVALAGLWQMVFYFLRGDRLIPLVPQLVTEAMFVGIGVIVIRHQLPVLFGYWDSKDVLAVFAEWPKRSGPLMVGLICLGVGVFAYHPRLKKFPIPLVSLAVGGGVAYVLQEWGWLWSEAHFLQLRESLENLRLTQFHHFFENPDRTLLVIKHSLMIAAVASFEALLTKRGMEPYDPKKRIYNLRSALFHQGVTNFFLGLLGGIPIIAEVVRSKANVEFGGTERSSNFFHGLFVGIITVVGARWLQYLPLSSLAAMLLIIGYRLINPPHLIKQVKQSPTQAVVIFVTVIVVVHVGLLTGIIVGSVLGHFFRLKMFAVR